MIVSLVDYNCYFEPGQVSQKRIMISLNGELISSGDSSVDTIWEWFRTRLGDNEIIRCAPSIIALCLDGDRWLIINFELFFIKESNYWNCFCMRRGKNGGSWSDSD